MAGILRPEQRATLPGEAARLGWVGGDSTPSATATVDWRAKVVAREMLAGLYEALRALVKDAPEEVIIAVGELMTYVVVACVFWDRRGGDGSTGISPTIPIPGTG